jgi:hypothetical protein
MAVMGLRLAGRSNAVSKLHGAVSRSMFSPLWPGVPEDEVPIGSVTNGVHPHTWVSSEMDALLERHVLPEWHEAGADRWARIGEAGDDEVWRVREQGREQLVSFVRSHLGTSLAARGMSSSDVAWTAEALDPKALTVCFARRFATYKRGTLLLSQPERLRALLTSSERPSSSSSPARRTRPTTRARRSSARSWPSRATRPSATASCSSTTTTSPSPGSCTRAPTSGSTTPPTAGGVRHERREGGAQRRPQLLDPRRLVGRDVRR